MLTIILRRRGTADVPFSSQSAYLFGLLNAAYYLFTLTLVDINLTVSHVFAGLALSVIPALAIDRLLKSRDCGARFTQTMTAYFGASLLLGLAQLLVTQALNANAAAMYIGLGLSIYTLFVLGAIVHEASGASMIRSVLFVFAISLFAGVVAVFLTPEKVLMIQQAVEQSTSAS
ncbi:hypothetical protein OAS86_05655 [Gammaproteobacteria bacterium]|nr:hypothetical protein [Gammaproteobacteria bacterium]